VRFPPVTEPQDDTPDERRTPYVRRVLIAVSIVAAVLLLWELRSVLVLIFGAVLIATIFRAIAAPPHRRKGRRG
jgi:hypothetical protein